MKVTDRIADLVIELGRHESYERVDGLIVGDEISLVNVLRLFHDATNTTSRGLLTEILSDVGYDWYQLDDALLEPQAQYGRYSGKFVDRDAALLSQMEFMQLSVTNTYLH